MLNSNTKKEIEKFTSDLISNFASPELITACQVLNVTDKDEHADNNGWIEALCGKHNNQRCRWIGQLPNIAVNDYVDVIFYPSYRLFVVFGQGGLGPAKIGNYLIYKSQIIDENTDWDDVEVSGIYYVENYDGLNAPSGITGNGHLVVWAHPNGSAPIAQMAIQDDTNSYFWRSKSTDNLAWGNWYNIINPDAVDVSYSNSVSGLIAEDVQAAIDEVDENLGSHLSNLSNPHGIYAKQVPYDNSVSGLIAEDVQAAIDEVDELQDDYLLVNGTRDSTGLQNFTAGIKTNTIAESTASAGVTVDGVLLKDLDVYPAGSLYGVSDRLFNCGWSQTSHFRPTSIPGAGGLGSHSWISDATFSGTPSGAYLVYSDASDYLATAPDASGRKHFLAKSSASPVQTSVSGRFSTGGTTEIGLRIDNGTNTNFAEVYVTGAPANGTIRLDFRTSVGPSAASGLSIQVGSFVNIMLIYFTSGTIAGYIIGENATVLGFSVGSVSFSPFSSLRAGLFTNAYGGNYAYCDWYYTSLGA